MRLNDYRGAWKKVRSGYRMCRHLIVAFGPSYAVLSDHNLTARVVDQFDVYPSLVGSCAGTQSSAKNQRNHPSMDHINNNDRDREWVAVATRLPRKPPTSG